MFEPKDVMPVGDSANYQRCSLSPLSESSTTSLVPLLAIAILLSAVIDMPVVYIGRRFWRVVVAQSSIMTEMTIGLSFNNPFITTMSAVAMFIVTIIA